MSSKLALQFQTLPGWAADVVTDGWVKVIDPPFVNPFASGVKAVGRVYIPDGDTNALCAQGAAGARDWFNRVAPTLLARPWVYAWELPNEPQPVADWNFCNALAAFTREAAGLMRTAGIKSVGGNLAEGNPGGATEQERANLFCAVARGLAECDYWSQHCYWVPDGYNHPEAGYNQWHARRDKLNAEYAAARGIKLPPRLITELGIDGGIVDRPKAGYRAFGLTFADYLRAHLARFDEDVAAENDVLAAFIFVAGGNADWQSFDLNEADCRQLAVYRATRAATPLPTEQPTSSVSAPLALARPLVGGAVSQWWGVNKAAYADIPGLTQGHNGIDYAAPRGTPVLAAHDGTAYRGLDPKGFGQYVKVMGAGHYTIYAHLDSYAIENGQAVRAGAKLGAVGTTGRSTGYHLHFGWKVTGAANPGYLDYQNPVIGRNIYDAARGA